MIKTYAISLERSTERRRHITSHLAKTNLDYTIINAIDGRNISQTEKEKLVAPDVINYRFYASGEIKFNNGAVGCQLSHIEAYKQFLNTDDEFAFVVEDDVVLPKNINQILENVTKYMTTDSVCLLHYYHPGAMDFSTINAIDLQDMQLLIPIEIPGSTAAYIIGRRAAIKYIAGILPIRNTADEWTSFYRQGFFSDVRILYPRQIQTKHFKSVIDYVPTNNLKGKILYFINRYKIPPVYQLLMWRRKRYFETECSTINLINEKSEFDK